MTSNCIDILRSVWISEQQDRYHHTTDEIMQQIVAFVDAKLCNITETEARELL